MVQVLQEQVFKQDYGKYIRKTFVKSLFNPVILLFLVFEKPEQVQKQEHEQEHEQEHVDVKQIKYVLFKALYFSQLFFRQLRPRRNQLKFYLSR